MVEPPRVGERAVDKRIYIYMVYESSAPPPPLSVPPPWSSPNCPKPASFVFVHGL